MRARITASLLAFLWVVGYSGGQVALAKPSESTCGDHGTNVHFEKTPSAAAKKALKEEKLVMVLHVSGDFENPEFT
jgi:hypothetical protein